MDAPDTAKRIDQKYISVELLKRAVNGEMKTHIMYKAKVKHKQLNEYILC